MTKVRTVATTYLKGGALTTVACTKNGAVLFSVTEAPHLRYSRSTNGVDPLAMHAQAVEELSAV